MSTPPQLRRTPRPSRIGCLAALAIGAAVPLAIDGALALIRDLPFDPIREWDPLTALIAVVPFAALALAGVRTRLPWLVAGVLTAALWGWFVLEHAAQPGVNFFLGPLILISPLCITLTAIATYGWQRESAQRKRRPNEDG